MEDPELTNKIQGICQKHGITINWIKSGENCANQKQQAIWIKEIAGSGDFTAALHEIGHVICDPESPPDSNRRKLDAEVNAWRWALDYQNGDIDLPGWNRLHESLHQYFVAVMDVSHPAYDLLVRAEEKNPRIRPRVSNVGAPQLTFGAKKKSKSKREPEQEP